MSPQSVYDFTLGVPTLLQEHPDSIPVRNPFSMLTTWSAVSPSEVEILELFISHPLLRANARLLSSLKCDSFETGSVGHLSLQAAQN